METNRDKLILIIGVGRSGTSLIHSIISSHRNVSGIPETQLLRKILKSKISFLNDPKKTYTKLIEKTNIVRLGLSEKKILEIISKSNSGYEFYWNIIEEFSGNNFEFTFCDKDPKLITCLKEIKALELPVKIIHIYRDPRAVINSRKRVAWTKVKNVSLHSIICNAQLKLVRTHRKGLEIHQVCYEDLLINPEEQLRKICSFLELQFSEDLLNFTETSKKLNSKEEIWKTETEKPIQVEFSYKYISQLSTSEIKSIELLYPEAFEYYNYQRTHGFSPFLLIMGKILNKVSSILYRIIF